MNLTWGQRKALEQKDILQRAAQVGVKARARGKGNIEMDMYDFCRLVDQWQRFRDLLTLSVTIADESPEGHALLADIKAALDGR